MQLQVPARLCNPADLTYAKASLTDEEMFEQRAVNNMLPRPYHPDLEAVDPKHPTRALAAAIHYQIRKKMFTKFPASQTKIADLFQVERKKFFTSITGREYEGRKENDKEETQNIGHQRRQRQIKGININHSDRGTNRPRDAPIGRCRYTDETEAV